MTTPLEALGSFARLVDAFSAPLGEPSDLPADLQPMAREVAGWDAASRRSLEQYASDSVYRRAVSLGVMIGDAIRLQRGVRTRRIDEWLAAARPDVVATFERWRDAFFARCDAIAALGTEGLVASELAMPDDGMARMVWRNPSRLARLLSGGSSLAATASVLRATAVLVVREWDFFGNFFVRQLRRVGLPLSARKAKRAIARLNAAASHPLITPRHAEPLLAAYAALAEHGVSESAADRIILSALDYGHRSSGKPWKGLIRLRELIVYSGVDPSTPDWTTIFDSACVAPVDYTHVPGREWIVRDYRLGKQLMQIDGKIAPGDRWAGLQQGRGSLSTGYLRAGQERIEFGRRYSKSLAAFLDSMVVAEGADHQRQRKAFLPFFSQAAILEHAAFVESTVSTLLDRAETVARQHDGAFDYRVDFAYEFPIRVICRILELPPGDVPSVQHWAEASVRSMDTEAGLTFANSREGQRAADQLRAYLEGKLTLARRGEFNGRVIGAIARDETLSEAERVANLGVVIFAGFETTTGLLSKGIETLLRHPAQWSYLRDALVPEKPVTVHGSLIPDLEWRWLAWARNQPERTVDVARRDRLLSLIDRSTEAAARAEAIRSQEELLDRAVEELLRWTAPGTVVPLTASKDLTVALESAMTIKACPHAAGDSLTIKRGETIAVAVDELNRRCPVGAGRFDGGEPSVLDVSRAENSSHLSFGLRHSCIGAFLAKENAKRAFEGTMRRFPDLELNGVPLPQEMELFSGLSSLPVRSRATGRRVLASTLVGLTIGCHGGTIGTIAASPAATGTLVVSNMNDNTATLLDARTLATLATLPTGRAPHEVAISRDGRWALVSNYGTRDAPGNTITVIDIDARAVARTIELSDIRRPHGMVFLPGDTVVAVTAETNRAVLLVDFRSGKTIRSLPTNGRAPHIVGSSLDGRRLVAGNIGDGTVAVLSPMSNDTTKTVKVGRQPEGVAITPNGARAWAGSNQDSIVVVVSLDRGEPIDTIRGFGLPYRLSISPDGRSVVVTDPVKGTVRMFDESTRRQRWTISISPDSLVPTAEVKGSASPEGVTISRDSRRAYVTLQGRNRVIAIDLEKGTIAAWGATGVWSDGIGFSPR